MRPPDDPPTPNQAAGVLGAAHTPPRHLLDVGRIPNSQWGTDRHPRPADPLSPAERQKQRRESALDEIARITHEHGGYPDDF
ncbi:hypothetical protein SAMN05444320_11827 [Streptoalloteichus hindustanus]|uniref:Uncharacterized protein n=1 Tax=Streptoalloteichus hindustanus TaxID=2017 RepID=A0A1M5PEC4_STRHI|nr:hypothetical protein SAMN05444320_11827 [Streptoalloteichus hindustanus]